MSYFFNVISFSSESVETAQRENEILQEEFDRLQTKYSKMQLELNEKEETFRRRLELLLFNLGTQREGQWPSVKASDAELRSPEFKPSEDARAPGYKTFFMLNFKILSADNY